MLSMFKGKKGFSVLFNSGDEGRQSATLSELSVCRLSSAHHSDNGCRPSRRSVAQYQCQRCSKRFSALEPEGEEASLCQCHRCGYPTCPQCRESATGSPPWVCCVCNGFKSIMWLLERTRAGPMLVTRIVEYCDPRRQRLMRSMFRFTLQQYQALTPRPSIALAGNASDGRAGSGAPSSSRRASKTPPPGLSKTPAGSRLSGERSGARLTQVSGSLSNVRRPSMYTHPKRASLLCSTRRSDTVVALTFDASIVSGHDDASKENTPVVECITRGSEALRRIEEPVGVVEYSPESKWRTSGYVSGEAEENGVRSPSLPGGSACFTHLEERCAAVADIYHAKISGAPSGDATFGTSVVELEAPSPLARPSGPAAFQRESLQPQVVTTNHAVTPTESDSLVSPASAHIAPGMSSMRVDCAEQPFRLGRSWSPSSNDSVRSTSPAPRFPTFVQFLDDRNDVIAGQTHLPRESDVLVTVSPDTEDGENEGSVVELDAEWRSSRMIPVSGNSKRELQTPRGAQQRTPLSACISGSPEVRSARRTSGLSYFTPTRALDMSSARATLHQGSSSRRRTTRRGLQDPHAPHLHGSITGDTGAAANGRRSGHTYDSHMHDPPSKLNSYLNSADWTHGHRRLQQAPITTRTAGRALGGDGRQRVVQRRTLTATPLERTASRNDGLQRMPSRNKALTSTKLSCAQLTRTVSSHGHGPFFVRTNSTTPGELTSKPFHSAHPTGDIGGRARLQRTQSNGFMRMNSGLGVAARVSAQGSSELEGTHLCNERHAPAGTSSVHMCPLTRTLSSGSLLKRTASHGCLSARGAAPFGRTKSLSSFKRSATSNTCLVEAGRVADVEVAAPRHRPSPRIFMRTATGTKFSSNSRAEVYDRNRYPLEPPPPSSSATLSGSTRKAPAGYQRVVAASPMRRIPTATRSATPTAFSRTGTGARNFQRQNSHTRREPVWLCGEAARRIVDPAPTLGGMMRRKAVGSTLHRTPSATGAPRSSSVALRTPRPIIIASVSTAATPAPITGGRLHNGCRPVLSSGHSGSKPRSSHGSRISDSRSRNSGDAGSAAVAEEKPPPGSAREQAGLRCLVPLLRKTTSKGNASPRVATPNHGETFPAVIATPRTRVRKDSSASPFARQKSCNHL
ncbi:hypothetical protein JKF63_02788 [Porcisia hertigi]|uniref:Uncharacterized protein n=1 Tax=Porcisia hertigi TaxID=2761500 RepID=A0A836L629_9TRYP|nr:hypothetical protein JKF63_02788 [Porcisia hertigi]